MKRELIASIVWVASCQQPQKAPPQPAPTQGQICVTVDPPDALMKVQGARVKNNGCVKAFGGEVAIEATAPGYEPYRILFPTSGHADIHHIQMKKEVPKPASTSQPAQSQPASTSAPASNPK